MEINQRLLRMAVVAQILGSSRAQAYALVAAGILPAVRLGRSVRVPSEALDEWIRRNTVGGVDAA